MNNFSSLSTTKILDSGISKSDYFGNFNSKIHDPYVFVPSVIAIIILLVLFFVFIALVLIKIKRINYEGFCIFRIHPDKKWVMRLTDINLSTILSFDLGAKTLAKNKFYSIDKFLDYFSNESKIKISDILENGDHKRKYKLTAHLNVATPNKIFWNHFFKNSSIKYQNVPLRIRISNRLKDDTHILQIYSRLPISREFTNIKQLQQLKFQDIVKKFSDQKFISIIISPHFNYIKQGLDNVKLSYLLNLLRLNPKNWTICIHEDLIYIFCTKKLSNFKFKMLENKLAHRILRNRKNCFFNPLIKDAALISSQPLNSPSEWENYTNMCVYSVSGLAKHIVINTLFYRSHHQINKADFDNFKVKFIDFKNKIQTSSFIKETAPIKDIKIDQNTENSVLLSKLLGFTNSDIEQFKKIENYNLIYTQAINKFEIDTIQDKNHYLIHTTENALLKSYDTFLRPNTTYIIHANNSEFDLNSLSLIDDRFKQIKNSYLGLYIEKISDDLTLFVQSNQIKTFIISGKLSEKLSTNSQEYVKFVNLIDIINRIPKSTVIWENLPDNLDSDVIESLNINFSYKNKYI